MALPKHNTNSLLFMPHMYEETMALLVNAHEYFSSSGRIDQQHYGEIERLIYASEMSRITLRLSAVMAWIMARRAQQEGELTSEEVRESYELGHRETCTETYPEIQYMLPEYVVKLIERSKDLYDRASRLEKLEMQQSG